MTAALVAVRAVALTLSSWIGLQHRHAIDEIRERVAALESALADLAGEVAWLQKWGGR